MECFGSGLPRRSAIHLDFDGLRRLWLRRLVSSRWLTPLNRAASEQVGKRAGLLHHRRTKADDLETYFWRNWLSITKCAGRSDTRSSTGFRWIAFTLQFAPSSAASSPRLPAINIAVYLQIRRHRAVSPEALCWWRKKFYRSNAGLWLA